MNLVGVYFNRMAPTTKPDCHSIILSEIMASKFWDTVTPLLIKFARAHSIESE